MTIASITLTDRDNGNIDLECKLDNPDAINEPPTAALVVSTYICAHFEKICRDASEWFVTQTLATAGGDETPPAAPLQQKAGEPPLIEAR